MSWALGRLKIEDGKAQIGLDNLHTIGNKEKEKNQTKKINNRT